VAWGLGDGAGALAVGGARYKAWKKQALLLWKKAAKNFFSLSAGRDVLEIDGPTAKAPAGQS
jgi:hypothetical protein